MAWFTYSTIVRNVVIVIHERVADEGRIQGSYLIESI
jgi:hypothetical protein